jgi:hypothetical protein
MRLPKNAIQLYLIFRSQTVASGTSLDRRLLRRHQQCSVERINDAYQKGLAVCAAKAVALEPVVIEASRGLSAK